MFRYESKTLFSGAPEYFKLALMLIISISAVAFYSLSIQLGLFITAFSLLLLSGFNEFKKLALTILPVLLLINFGMYLFFSQIDPAYLERMLIITLRICAVYFSFAFFLRITNIFALIKWMRNIGLPETLYLALYVALRFLPEVEHEMHAVRAAQKLRNSSVNPVSASVALLVPMLYVLIDRADELSIAYYLRKKSGRV